MGKKSSDVPAPDPRLVEAQIRSMGIQDDAIQRIMANSEALMPIQREQLQFGLDSARQAYEDSRADRDWMLQRRGQLGALQDRMVLDANAFNTEERRNELRGEAYADVNQAFAGAQDMGLRAMSRMGINPSSGRAQALSNQTSIAQAAALASAGHKVSQAARAEGYALTDRAANALAGYPSMGMQATSAGAGFGTAGLGLANQGLAGVNSGFNSAGGLAGQMGNNATNMWGAQANYSASMQQNESLGGILGGVGGLAMGLGKSGLGLVSDRRLKQDIELVGRDERTGLNLYEFGYIDDPDMRRYVGVMADEVIAYDPRAVSFDEHGYARVDYARLGIPFKEVV